MENLSLFNTENPVQDGKTFQTSAPLEVVKMEFSSSETLAWQELFSGFDTIHAVTYSSGIGFVYQLLNMFQQAEIIFGCEEVISYSLQEVMAYQSKMVERIRETASQMKLNLVSRIEQGTLRFYVAHNVLSHEKLYLLSASDGRKRVIMGSANMSYSAFGGFQRENICYMDSIQAYNWYWNCYCQLRDESTDQIVKEALLCSDNVESPEILPIAGTVKLKKAMVLESVKEMEKEVRFALDVRNLSEKFAPAVQKPDKNGKWILTADTLKSIRRKVVSNREIEREQQSVYPQLEVFPDEMRVRLNGTDLDLSPSPNEIRHDTALFLQYMNGYENFHGDVANMQRRYYEFANWFFCSPFMAYMRNMAVYYNHNLLSYPVFGLVYGQSKAGKTSFLETLLKMMIGQKTKLSAPDFTRSSIEKLKHAVQGTPIIVDDLTNARFNQHAIETIKNDNFGIADHLLHYPAIVISANEDVKAVSPEIIRRTVICRVQAGLTNTEVMRSNTVRTVQSKIGTAFYREYLRIMLKIVSQLLEKMKEDSTEYSPDILAASSQVLMNIFTKYTDGNLPFYVRKLTLNHYFSEKVTGHYAIKTIRNAWKINHDSFQVSERTNELCFNAGAPYEADRVLKELPENLEAQKVKDCIIMNLSEARKFFGLSFKKSFLEQFRKF